MIKKYKATFLDYFQTDTLYTKVHIAVFDVNTGPDNYHEILFFTAHEIEDYDFDNNEFFRFCHHLSMITNSKKVNFKKIKGKKCLVEIKKSQITSIHPSKDQSKGF